MIPPKSGCDGKTPISNQKEYTIFHPIWFSYFTWFANEGGFPQVTLRLSMDTMKLRWRDVTKVSFTSLLASTLYSGKSNSKPIGNETSSAGGFFFLALRETWDRLRLRIRRIAKILIGTNRIISVFSRVFFSVVSLFNISAEICWIGF